MVFIELDFRVDHVSPLSRYEQTMTVWVTVWVTKHDLISGAINSRRFTGNNRNHTLQDNGARAPDRGPLSTRRSHPVKSYPAW